MEARITSCVMANDDLNHNNGPPDEEVIKVQSKRNSSGRLLKRRTLRTGREILLFIVCRKSVQTISWRDGKATRHLLKTYWMVSSTYSLKTTALKRCLGLAAGLKVKRVHCWFHLKMLLTVLTKKPSCPIKQSLRLQLRNLEVWEIGNFP